MSVLSGIRGLLKSASGFAKKDSVRQFSRDHPLATFGLVAPTAQFLATDVAAPIGRGIFEAMPFSDLIEKDREERQIKREREGQARQLEMNMRSARIEEMVQRNMAVVAQKDPHLFNQVMSGRMLPQGAVVLGGPRRQDLMEELAFAMGDSSTPEAFTSLIQ